jgi:hypothetical protein
MSPKTLLNLLSTEVQARAMSAVKLCIARDGAVRGLWTDDIELHSSGSVSVRRASHVEFCRRRQMWYVRIVRPCGTLRRVFQFVVRRPCGEFLHWAVSRSDALAWEAAYASMFLTVVDDGRGAVSVGVLLARETATSDERSRPGV